MLVEVLPCRNTEVKQVQSIEESGTTWMTPIWNSLSQGIVPEDKNEARKLRLKAPKYVIQNGVLFKRAYLQPLLRCVGPKQADYVLREMHEGSCGSRVGPRMLAKKIIRLGYYWPTMYHDAQELVKKCKKCQVHSNVCHLPQHDMVPVTSSWPFSQWGIDIVGPFPLSPLLIVFIPRMLILKLD